MTLDHTSNRLLTRYAPAILRLIAKSKLLLNPLPCKLTASTLDGTKTSCQPLKQALATLNTMNSSGTPVQSMQYQIAMSSAMEV